jgi:uncharacterized protein YkwD
MKMNKLSLVWLAIPLLLSACLTPPTGEPTGESPEGTAVAAKPPTYTPVPTYTPAPTYTPVATYTPVPTYTPEPTYTPQIAEIAPTARPTKTPTGSATKTPTRPATNTPTRTSTPTPKPTSTRLPPTPTRTPAASPTPTLVAAAELSDLEQDMLEAINAERAAEGLPALTVDPVLTELARGHAQDMIDRNYFSHVTLEGLTYRDRLKERGIELNWVGENFYADSCSEEDIVECTMNWLMGDPPHKANIMHKHFELVGIGMVKSEHGMYMTVQDFTEAR